MAPASWEILDARLATQFSPCGMVWEHLRSCYQFTMRVFVGGQPVTVPARWYWCSPGAQPFPGVHGCQSSVWLQNGEVNSDWGEVTPYPTDPTADAIRGLDRGANGGYPGQCFVGDPQWFLDGQLPAGILNGPFPPFSACCKPGSASSTGGILLGGGGTVPCQRWFGFPGHTCTAVLFDPVDGPLNVSVFWQIQFQRWALTVTVRGHNLLGYWMRTDTTCQGSTAGQMVWVAYSTIQQAVYAFPLGNNAWQIPPSSPYLPGDIVQITNI